MATSNPGDVLIYDYRPEPFLSQQQNEELKVLQWNIERGYKLSEIILEIKNLDPDIVFLQEVDIGCLRSGRIDQMIEICSSCGLLGGFVTEFIEIESELRSYRDQGGGVHGNAILSKFDMDFHTIDHKYQPIEWEKAGYALNEPRKGRRFTLVAEVNTPGQKTLCYSAHLEVFCGLTGRIAQFSEILSHALKKLDEFPFQLLFGDLNTMAHSIARLSPKYCCDEFRWKSLGYSESEWWWKYVLSWHVKDGPINLKLASILNESSLNNEMIRSSRNPGFFDPWDPVKDITLDNPTYYGYYKAKLDWTLLRGFEVFSKSIGNQCFTASDHCYLFLRLNKEANLSMYENHELFRSRIPKVSSYSFAGVTKKATFGTFVLLVIYNYLSN